MKFMTFIWKDAEKYGVANVEQGGVWDIASLAHDSCKDCPTSLIDGIIEGDAFMDKITSLIK